MDERSIEQKLNDAAQEGNIESLYDLLGEDQYLLETVDQNPFIDTPLHLAVSARQTRFAMEIASLKPSFARKLNRDGLSPMHLALANGDTKMARGLLVIDKELVRVKGKGRRTPLHCAVLTGNIDILREFLFASPDSVEDLTVQFETALHLAMKNCELEAFRVLLEKLEQLKKMKLLNWKDEDGNNVLHVATSTNQRAMVELLVNKNNVNGIEINALNAMGWTALDILQHLSIELDTRNMEEILCRNMEEDIKNMEEILQRAGAVRAQDITPPLQLPTNTHEHPANGPIKRKSRCSVLSPQESNALTVFAALIVTATFQVGINPPCGVWQEDYIPNQNSSTTNMTTTYNQLHPHYAGRSTMRGDQLPLIWAFNSMGFFSSLLLLILLRFEFFLPVIDWLVVTSLLSVFFTYILSQIHIVPTESMPKGNTGLPSDSSPFTVTYIVIGGFMAGFIIAIWYHTRKENKTKRVLMEEKTKQVLMEEI